MTTPNPDRKTLRMIGLVAVVLMVVFYLFFFFGYIDFLVWIILVAATFLIANYAFRRIKQRQL